MKCSLAHGWSALGNTKLLLSYEPHGQRLLVSLFVVTVEE